MDEDILYKLLGTRIKYLRENKGLTQDKLAEKTGLSIDYIGKIEVNILECEWDTCLYHKRIFRLF